MKIVVDDMMMLLLRIGMGMLLILMGLKAIDIAMGLYIKYAFIVDVG